MSISNVSKLLKPNLQRVTCEISENRLTRKIANSIKSQKTFMEHASTVKEFPVYQPVAERAIALMERVMRLKGYSKVKKVAEIEKELGKKGVFVRFNNNEAMAHLVRNGLKQIEKAGYELPKQIYVVKRKVIPGMGGYTLSFRNKTAEKAPILLSDILPYIPSVCNKHLSTKGKSHSVIHEVGHWLHLQEKPNNEICKRIWKTADKELIREQVSSEALRRDDGQEFVAEVFTGMVGHKKYSKHVMEIYKQLKGPLPKNKLFAYM